MAAAGNGSTIGRATPSFSSMATVAEVDELAGRLAELLNRVRRGEEVLLTQDHKPVARLVPPPGPPTDPRGPLTIRSIKGHRVLTPVFSQAELAEEMFAPR